MKSSRKIISPERIIPAFLLLLFVFCLFSIFVRTSRNLNEEDKHFYQLPLQHEYEGGSVIEDHFNSCTDKNLIPQYTQKGNYWVLYNYVRASRTFHCNESVTYTTISEYTFLDNLIPVTDRWRGPVSVSVYAPGTDFQRAMETILYLRKCGNSLIKELVTFHFYFDSEHVPEVVPNAAEVPKVNIECSSFPVYPWQNSNTYRKRYQLKFPINVGRNIAREMSTTHFVFPSDIELYPSPNLIPKFLEMLKIDNIDTSTKTKKVYVLPIIEIESSSKIPISKDELVNMVLHEKTAISFRQGICPHCFNTPGMNEWLRLPVSTELHVFKVAKRSGDFSNWEPFFIGTNEDPFYDERLTWEGRGDKRLQAMILCLLDYEFRILDNAFLVHKPGIRRVEIEDTSVKNKQRVLIWKQIIPQIYSLYGKQNQCVL